MALVDAGGPFAQGNALLDDEQRIAENRQGDRHLHGDQDGADFIAAHGGEDGTQFHDDFLYCALSCQAGCTCAARQVGYSPASMVATTASSDGNGDVRRTEMREPGHFLGQAANAGP